MNPILPKHPSYWAIAQWKCCSAQTPIHDDQALRWRRGNGNVICFSIVWTVCKPLFRGQRAFRALDIFCSPEQVGQRARFGIDDNPGCGLGDGWGLESGGKGGCQGSATLLQASCKTRQNTWNILQLRVLSGLEIHNSRISRASIESRPFSAFSDGDRGANLGTIRKREKQELTIPHVPQLHPKKQTFDWSRSAIELLGWSSWFWDIHKSLRFCSANMDTPVYWYMYLQMYLERFSCSKVIDWYCQRERERENDGEINMINYSFLWWKIVVFRFASFMSSL